MTQQVVSAFAIKNLDDITQGLQGGEAVEDLFFAALFVLREGVVFFQAVEDLDSFDRVDSQVSLEQQIHFQHFDGVAGALAGGFQQVAAELGRCGDGCGDGCRFAIRTRG